MRAGMSTSEAAGILWAHPGAGVLRLRSCERPDRQLTRLCRAAAPCPLGCTEQGCLLCSQVPPGCSHRSSNPAALRSSSAATRFSHCLSACERWLLERDTEIRDIKRRSIKTPKTVKDDASAISCRRVLSVYSNTHTIHETRHGIPIQSQLTVLWSLSSATKSVDTAVSPPWTALLMLTKWGPPDTRRASTPDPKDAKAQGPSNRLSAISALRMDPRIPRIPKEEGRGVLSPH